MSSELFSLPALRCLGSLADVRPTIVIDTREQTPLAFTRLTAQRGTLQTGDYSFAGGEDLFAIERKTVADLVACCYGENRAIEARFDVPVVFRATPAAAAFRVECWAFWFARELVEQVNDVARGHGLTRGGATA